MGDARADESTDDDRDREGIDPLVAHQVPRAADRHERSGEHSDEGEYRVPGDAERPDQQIRVERQLDQVVAISGARRPNTVSRMIIGIAPARTNRAMTWSSRSPKT